MSFAKFRDRSSWRWEQEGGYCHQGSVTGKPHRFKTVRVQNRPTGRGGGADGRAATSPGGRSEDVGRESGSSVRAARKGRAGVRAGGKKEPARARRGHPRVHRSTPPRKTADREARPIAVARVNAIAAELAAQSRRAQGLRERIEEPEAVARIVALLNAPLGVFASSSNT